MTLSELNSLLIANLTRVGSNRITGPEILQAVQAIVSYFATQIVDVLPAWESGFTFQTDGSDNGKYCTHPDSTGKKRIWETKGDDNTGHEPPTNPLITEDAFWLEVSASAGSSIQEHAPGVYGPGLVIVFHNHSVDGRNFYQLINPTRPFTSANIETEITGGDWALIGAAAASGGGPAIDEVYANIAALLADQSNQEENAYYWVTDASTDATVDSGWAIYRKLAASTANIADYVKVQEQESLDIVSTPDASETVAGKVEEATDAEVTAGTATGGSGAKLFVTPAKLATRLAAWWTAIKAATQTITAKWTFSDVALTNQIEATKKVGVYIDTDGTLTKVPWLEYDTSNNKLTLTGVDTSASTVSLEILNNALGLIARFLNNGAIEVGGTVFDIRVDDAISSGNASITLNTNQSSALQVVGKSGNIFFQIDSTTGAPFLLIRQAWKESIQGLGFEVVHTCFTATVAATAGGTTIIGSIPIATNESIDIKVKHMLAIAPDGSTVGGDGVGLFRNNAGTMVEDAKTVNVRKDGGVTATWVLDDNNGTKTVDIIFTNNTGTGLAYEVNVSVRYLKKIRP